MRLFSDCPETLDSLLMGIGNTLWDLVQYYSEKDCHICLDRGFNYLFIEVRETKQNKVILECNLCSYTENLDGSQYTDGLAITYPVNDDILSKYGVESRT